MTKTRTKKPNPGSVLTNAHKLINGPRLKEYGNPKNGFDKIAAFWSIYLGVKYRIFVNLTAEDICWMMVDFKKCRQMHAPKRDNLEDAAGYIGLIEKVLGL